MSKIEDKIGFVRLAWLLLGLFFVGKLVVTMAGGSYELSNRLFAMVPLTVHLCLIWGAMTRAFRGASVGQAFQVGVLIALFAQVLIFSGTVISYLMDASTAFSNPVAIVGEDRVVTMGEAVVGRGVGLIVNMVVGGVSASIGWALGKFLPAN